MELRSKSVRGGAYLTVREGFGMLLRFGGIFVVTKLLGPSEFGIYAGALAIVNFLAVVAQMGVEIELIRGDEEPTDREYDAAFTLLCMASAAALILGLGGVAGAWSAGAVSGRTAAVFAVLACSLPINILWAPAQGKIERAFGFRQMAVIELVGDILLYGVSVGLALADLGVWAPVIGVFAWQTWLLLGSYALAHLRPRLRWDRTELLRFVRFGRGYTLSIAADRSRDLINPLVVGQIAGATAVGQLAFALRIVELVGFVFRASWRLAHAALNRVKHDLTKFRYGFEEGIVLHLLAIGPIMIAATWLLPWVISTFGFGDYEEATSVFPWLAVGTFTVGFRQMLATALYAFGRNGAITVSNGLRVAIQAGVCALTVDRFGIKAFGIGEIAGIAALVVLDWALRQELTYNYSRAIPWLLAFLPPLCAPALPAPWRPLTFASVVVVLAMPAPRRQLQGYLDLARGRRPADLPADLAGDGAEPEPVGLDTVPVTVTVAASRALVSAGEPRNGSNGSHVPAGGGPEWVDPPAGGPDRKRPAAILDDADRRRGRSSGAASRPVHGLYQPEGLQLPATKAPAPSSRKSRRREGGRDIVFVAWTARPARVHEIAEAVGAEAKILPASSRTKLTVPFRYLRQSFQTFFFLMRRRPDVVMVVNPPVVAAAVVTFYSRFSRARVVLDSHPGGFGAQGDKASARFQWLHRWSVRRAAAVMVTTREWVQTVNSWGGRAIMVHEPPPAFHVPPPEPRPTLGRVLYVTIFAPDEPLQEVIDAARALPDVEFQITGDPRRCPAQIRERVPDNVVFVGYLRGDDYVRALVEADVVLALTTEPTSVMRAAYEAVYAYRPLLVSDWPALRETFPLAVPVHNDGQSIAEAVVDTLNDYDAQVQLLQEARRLQEQRWADQLDDLRSVVLSPESGLSSKKRRHVGPRWPWLRRRGWIVLLTAGAVTAGTFLGNQDKSTTYTAEAFLFVPSGANAAGPGDAFAANRLALTYVSSIPHDAAVLRHVADAVGETDTDEVDDDLGVATTGDNAVMRITYSSEDEAKALAAVRAATEVITGSNGFGTASIPPGAVIPLNLPPDTSESSGGLLTPEVGLVLGLALGFLLAAVRERGDARVDTTEQLVGLVSTPVSDARANGPSPALVRRWVANYTGPLVRIGLLAAPPNSMRASAWTADWLASAYPEIFPAVGSTFSSRVVQVDPYVEPKAKPSSRRAASRDPIDVELIAAGTAVGGENGESAALEAHLCVLVVPAGSRARHVTRSVRTLRQLGIECTWSVLVPGARGRRRLVPSLPVFARAASTRGRSIDEDLEVEGLRVPE
jgi:PST family polysaccharide transporter